MWNFVFFRCRYLLETYSYAFPIYQGVLALFVILNLSLATFMDPGIYPKGKTGPFCADETLLRVAWEYQLY